MRISNPTLFTIHHQHNLLPVNLRAMLVVSVEVRLDVQSPFIFLFLEGLNTQLKGFVLKIYNHLNYFLGLK